MRKSKFSESQIVAMLKDAESGVPVAEATATMPEADLRAVMRWLDPAMAPRLRPAEERLGAALTATSHDAPAANSPNAFDAATAAFALIEHKEHTNMKPKNTMPLVRQGRA